MRKIIVSFALAVAALFTSLVFTAPASAASSSPVVPYCGDRLVRTYFEPANVYGVPGTWRRVVSTNVLKQLVAQRHYDRWVHRCVLDGYQTTLVYRADRPYLRPHLVLFGPLLPSNWHYGAGVSYWGPWLP